MEDRRLIFLVDDSDTTLTLGSDALSGLYRVMTFNSGVRMFKVLDRVIPDLIILDVKMPEMSGYEIIRMLKRNTKTAHIPVIFLTGKDSEESEIEGLDLGAADYIAKPVSAPRLRKRVEVCLLLESQKLDLINYNENLEKMVDERTRSVMELKNVVLKTMAYLVECRDHFTGNHIERTQQYIKILFDIMKTTGTYADDIADLNEQLAVYSCQLHDVGKIRIKDSILLKPGKLSAEEFDEMKKHTEYGGNIIEQIKVSSSDSEYLNYAKEYALYHHEKWNGKGYPFGLKGQDIPLLGRVMAIADVYDALISKRPYKNSFSHNDAVRIIISESGISFDPLLIALFVDVHKNFELVSNLRWQN